MISFSFLRRAGTLLLLLIVLLVFTPVKAALAADEFATNYDVVYDVDDSGITTVTEKVILKNLTSQYYASEFKLTIGATQIYDVKGSDGSGALDIKTETIGTTTQISVKFNQQVAGLGKTLPWTLQFKSKDFAEKIGKVWEVRAPKVSASTNLESYSLTLTVPQDFGEPTVISPTPKSQTVSLGKMFLNFDKEQLQTSGVSASFGQNQLFDFDLTYHLQNDNLVSILTSIALPPDTGYQDVIFQKIEPKPLNVTVDEDGNYLAWYKLKRGEKMDIKVFGSAKLYTGSKVKNPFLSADLRKKYTQPDKYWESNNHQITGKLADILATAPSATTQEKAKLIFQYVVDSLKYDSSRLKDSIERLGAVTVLNNPSSAVCMEFTDLFIALSRAAGIPARELDGYAYSNNTLLRPLSLTKDVLHAWPEYFDDKKGWVMVDPTWENTTNGVDYFNKLDLNHFAFVTKGLSSTQPIPAGSYKYFGEDTHDVKVTLSENDFLGKGQIDVQIDAPNPIFAGFPGKISVKVANVGDSIFTVPDFAVTANNLTILDGENQTIKLIPSYGSATIELNTRTKSLFDTYNDQITVIIGSQKFTKEVQIKPFFIFQTIPLVSIGIVLGMAAVYLLVLGGLIYRKKLAKIRKS